MQNATKAYAAARSPKRWGGNEERRGLRVRKGETGEGDCRGKSTYKVTVEFVTHLLHELPAFT